MSKKFNVRVYGILEKEDCVLVSDENRFGTQFTKFPGGGLEWGEGVKECLVREFQEELSIDIQLNELYYLTDYFQVSAFNEKDQIISVYYTVSTNDLQEIPTVQKQFDFDGQEQVFRWVPKSEILVEQVTFPIDERVARMLYNGELK